MPKSDAADNGVLEPKLGKPEFWRDFLTEQIPRLYQMFQRHGIHTALAEELVQTTVLDAIKGTKSYDPKRGNPQQWLFGIANNALALEMRQRQYRPRYNGDLLDYMQEIDTQPLPEDVLENQENVGRIREAMAALEPSQQEVLTARYHEDLSVRQISQKMNLTEKAVESLLYRARNTLRSKLQETNPLPREN
jgi:RNA polymerase sigma-70 factor (ECF subfamily)